MPQRSSVSTLRLVVVENRARVSVDRVDRINWTANCDRTYNFARCRLLKARSLVATRSLLPLALGAWVRFYRARDGKLKRDVAIKVILEDFAQDAERMKRFEREAQVLASLNHPHIASIYGLEENALILELVEGPTVAGRIMVATSRYIPTVTASRFFRQARARRTRSPLSSTSSRSSSASLRPSDLVGSCIERRHSLRSAAVGGSPAARRAGR